MNECKICATSLLVLIHLCVCGDETFRTSTRISATDTTSTSLTFSGSVKTIRHARRELSHWKPGKPFCMPRDSCQHRCGQRHYGKDVQCMCDKACVFYSDCCVDYELECGGDVYRESTSVVRASPACVSVSSEYSFDVYVISECSPAWDSGNSVVQSFLVTNIEFCQRFFGDSSWYECFEKITESCRGNASYSEQSWMVRNFVYDSGWYVYSNHFCAMCNWQASFNGMNDSIQPWSEDNLSTERLLRRCSPYISTCASVRGTEDQIFEKLCHQYSGPIAVPHVRKESKIYRNTYCAICNREVLNGAFCVPMGNSSRNTAVFSRVGVLTINNRRPHNIPAAFSLLLNFGLDGRQRVMMTSDDEDEIAARQKVCGSTHIWDPFNKLCRRLYCSTNYILVDFQCVKDSGNQKEDGWTIDGGWGSVHLSLSVQVVLFDLLNFHGREDNLSQVFADSFAEEYNITSDRIRNVKVNIALGNLTDLEEMKDNLDEIDENLPITFVIDLDLYESVLDVNDAEPDIDSIVRRLSSSVSSSNEGLYLEMNNMKSRIFQVQRSSSSSWCSPETGGTTKRYWNSDFTFIGNGNESLLSNGTVEAVYVNKTGKLYRKGYFFANILYQRIEDSSDRGMNVSKMVVVCDRNKILNESCPRLMIQKGDYRIDPNGSLVLLKEPESGSYEGLDLTAYELEENGSVLLCLWTFNRMPKNQSVIFEVDITEAYVSLVLMCTSIFSLAIVILTYTLFSSLRNLPGCNTMNLTFSLFAMQVTFLLGQRSGVNGTWCSVSAVALHYEILCSFMWMNVMAYDLYKTFGTNSLLTVIRSKKDHLASYLLYSYGCPLSIVALGLILDALAHGSMLAPHYGEGNNSCWIRKHAAIAFFAVPLGVVMLINVIFYSITIVAIRSVKHTVNVSNVSKRRRHGWADVMLYARMAFVTGLTWTLIFVAAYVPADSVMGKIITYAFIIFNTMQGVFIFIVFVCNRRVFGLYIELIKKIGSTPVSISSGSSIFSRNAIAVNRSVSADTTLSTLSVSSSQK